MSEVGVCVICQESLLEDEDIEEVQHICAFSQPAPHSVPVQDIVALKCGHKFHSKCIQASMSQWKFHCPLCRSYSGPRTLKRFAPTSVRSGSPGCPAPVEKEAMDTHAVVRTINVGDVVLVFFEPSTNGADDFTGW